MKLLHDPGLRESLYCIRCGACLNVCPVYQTIGGHSYGTHYSGPIGSVITPVFDGLEEASALPYASSLCGSCSEICPVKIPLHHMLLYHRHRIVEKGITSRVEKIAFRLWLYSQKSRRLYAISGAVGRFLTDVFKTADGGLFIPGWSETRYFPALPQKSFKQLWRKREQRS